MSRSVLLSALTSFVILLSTGCSATDHRVERNKNENRSTNENVQVTFDPERSGDLIGIDFYESTDGYIEDLIKEISPKIGLTPLAKTSAGSEKFEFRIWTDLGARGDPKLLGVRLKGNEKKAYYFEIYRDSYTSKSRKEHLADPTSGWNGMISEVRNRLSAPKGLVRDPQFKLSRDEPIILLEVLDKTDYRRVFYGKNTTFPDGKRLIDVCDYLASEFDVDMNCRRQGAGP